MCRIQAFVILLSSLLACTPSQSDTNGPDGRPDDSGTPESTPTGETGTPLPTGDTAVEPQIHCSLLVPAGDVEFTVSSDLVTEEDFDFDGQGWLSRSAAPSSRGSTATGNPHFVAANIGPDATGIRSPAQGESWSPSHPTGRRAW